MLDGMPRHAQLAAHAAWYAACCLRIGLAGRSVVCPTCLHWMVMISVVFYLCFDTEHMSYMFTLDGNDICVSSTCASTRTLHYVSKASV